MSGKSFMNDDGESYCGTVPTKQPNKGDGSPAEVVEGRRQTKENTQQPNLCRTPSRETRPSGLERVRETARKDGKLKFTALLHHVSIDLLRDSYHSLKKQAAPGVDGMTWEEFGHDLEARLADLHGRIHRGAYRAQPSRRVWIPKADGRQRPLGIAALEDKIVQYAVGAVLNQIWEEDFLGFSYGFRPGRGAHDALDALWVGIVRKKVNWILDLDIRSFFDKIQHSWLIQFVEHRIGDRRVVRLIQKWLKAGVIEQGQWHEAEEGSPQGAVITPLTQKVISSSLEQLLGGEKGINCLISVVKRNIVMANGALHQGGESSPNKCRSWPAAAWNRAARGSASSVTGLRFVRAASISLFGRSLPARSAGKNSRSHSSGHLETSPPDRRTAPKVCKEQRSHPWSDRNRRVKRVFADSKEAWLSRIERAALFKFRFPIRWIACSSRSSRRLTRCWSHVASAPSAHA